MHSASDQFSNSHHVFTLELFDFPRRQSAEFTSEGAIPKTRRLPLIPNRERFMVFSVYTKNTSPRPDFARKQNLDGSQRQTLFLYTHVIDKELTIPPN